MAAMGNAAAGAKGRLRSVDAVDDAPAMLFVIDELEVGVHLDPVLESVRREEAVEKTPTATVQHEGPGGSVGPDLHIEEV